MCAILLHFYFAVDFVLMKRLRAIEVDSNVVHFFFFYVDTNEAFLLAETAFVSFIL